MSGFDSSLFGPTIAEAADVATIVEFVMTTTNSDANAQLFWTVAGDGGFSEQRSQRFTLTPDGEPHTYQIELSTDPDWAGTITRLRFDPVSTSHGGAIAIDSIRLLAAVAVPEPAGAAIGCLAGLVLLMGRRSRASRRQSERGYT